MAKFKIHLLGNPTPIAIEAAFDTPETLYAAAAAAQFVVGVARKTTSNSVSSKSAVLVSFAAIAMVEAEA